MWLARLFGVMVPTPNLWILLDAPPEVLQARKQEVPFAESARQRQCYIALIKKLKHAVVVDASQEFEQVFSATYAAISLHD